MTEREQALADDKMRAEISRLVAETGKMVAETGKLNKETRWYELVIFAGGASAMTLAIVAVTKLFF